MKPLRRVARVGVALGAMGLAASAGVGAQMQYDPNCNAIEPTEYQQTVGEICSSHIGCRMVIGIGNKGCKVLNFLRGRPDAIASGRITNEDVVESDTADIPYTSTGQAILNNVRRAARRLVATEGNVFRTAEGTIGYEETSPLPSGLKSGSIVYSTGTMARGQFDSSNRLQGPGQLITADGKVRAGAFFNSTLKGEGFVTDRESGRTVLVEGTFDGDTPVGEVIRTYADGSSVRERWENGKLVERGAVAAKGQVPPRLTGQPTAIARAGTNSAVASGTSLAGNWRAAAGVISLTARPGGYDARAISGYDMGAFAKALQPGSGFLQAAPDGTFRLTFPDGKQSVVQPVGADRIRVTLPNGWSDIFVRVQPAAETATSKPPEQSRPQTSSQPQAAQQGWWRCDKGRRHQIRVNPNELRIPMLTSTTSDTILARQSDGSFLYQDRPGPDAYKTIVRFYTPDRLNISFTNLKGVVNLTYDCVRE